MKILGLVRRSALAAALSCTLHAQTPAADKGTVESDAVAKLVSTWNFELAGDRGRELALARELAGSSGPDWVAAWAKGAVCRLTSLGKPIDVRYTAVDGRKVDLRNLKGKVVLIDFWATWCPPCIESLPTLKAAFAKYHGQGLEIMGISWDSDRAKFLEFIAKEGMGWPQDFEGTKPGRLGEAFGIGGIPYVLLVDKGGSLRFASAGAEDSVLKAQIEKLLAE